MKKASIQGVVGGWLLMTMTLAVIMGEMLISNSFQARQKKANELKCTSCVRHLGPRMTFCIQQDEDGLYWSGNDGPGPSLEASQLAASPESSPAPLAVRFSALNFSATDDTAELRYEFVFANRTGQAQEICFTFWAPAGATVCGAEMLLGGVWKQGRIEERKWATTVYEQTVRRLKDPLLVESVGPESYQLRIFPIAPYSESRVCVSLIQPFGLETDLPEWCIPYGTRKSDPVPVESSSYSFEFRSKRYRTNISAVGIDKKSVEILHDGVRWVSGNLHGRLSEDLRLNLYFQENTKGAARRLAEDGPSGDKTTKRSAWVESRFLLGQIDRMGPAPDQLERIIALSRAHALLTPYTAFLLLPDSEGRVRGVIFDSNPPTGVADYDDQDDPIGFDPNSFSSQSASQVTNTDAKGKEPIDLIRN